MNWDDYPETLTTRQVATITGDSLKGLQNRMALARYPIAHIRGVRPYRFTKRNVRAYVEDGRATAISLLRRNSA